jgi:hypothetical protein
MKQTRKPSKLSSSLQRHLNAYALAATAAGVGMLALSDQAEAKIVYTPDHRHVPLNHQLSIDLNRDGVADFHIRRGSGIGSTTYSNRFSFTAIGAAGFRGNGIVAYRTSTSSSSVLSPLHGGQQISSDLLFFVGHGSDGYMANRTRPVSGNTWRCFGPWNNVRNRYLGLKFKINGRVHYGWARLNESCNRDGERGTGAQALLTGYAYETIPNKPIITGKTKGPDVITLEPGSLGALAAGASALHK